MQQLTYWCPSGAEPIQKLVFIVTTLGSSVVVICHSFHNDPFNVIGVVLDVSCTQARWVYGLGIKQNTPTQLWL